jgi:hypothetical protein
LRTVPGIAIVQGMAQRWRKVTLAPENLPLVVLWSEMLAATGLPDFRASQLAREGRFPIHQLPYFGYQPKGRRPVRRNQIDVRSVTFSKVEVSRFIALPEHERNSLTLMEWEMPRCCHCPFHCPPAGGAQEHPYAARFKTRWWNR